MKRFFLSLSAVALFTIVLSGVPVVAAPVTAEGAPKAWQTIRLRHLPPELVLWFIDPKRYPEPEMIRLNRENLDPNLKPGSPSAAEPVLGGGSKLIGLPAGVDAAVAAPELNSVVAYGTPDGLAALQMMVAFFDRPWRQVEIEVRYVDISRDDATALGADATADGPKLAMAPGNVRKTLDALVAQGKAKIISVPRVVAINNQTARISIAASEAVSVGLSYSTGQPLVTIQPGAAQTGSSLTTRRDFVVTPTINNDETVTLALHLAKTLWLTNDVGQNKGKAPHDSGFLLQTPESMMTVANIKDGDTVVIGGLTTQVGLMSEPASTPQPDAKRPMVVLVTARIVRRLDGGVPAPGN